MVILEIDMLEKIDYESIVEDFILMNLFKVKIMQPE